MAAPRKQTTSPLRTRLTIGLVGFLLSIALHELFHVLLHVHQIAGVRFFPNFYTIAELVIKLPADYDLASEEFVAYAISAGVLITTAILIGKVSDSQDRRTANQILFPERFPIHKLVPGLRKSPPKKAITKQKTSK